MTEITHLPVATICAPVSVAMSMTSSARTMGPDANATPSARTTRPSASVLLTSIVRPLRVEEGPHEASSGWS